MDLKPLLDTIRSHLGSAMTQIHFCFILGKIKLSKHLQGHEVKFSAAAEAEHLLALGPSPDSLWKVQTGIFPVFWVVWLNLHTRPSK